MHNASSSNNKPSGMGRRKFFRHLLANTLSFIDELKGIPQMSLSALDQVPDEIILEMVPVFYENCEHRIEEDHLLVRKKKSNLFEEICRLNAIERFVINRMNGYHRIKDLRNQAAYQFALEREKAFEHVKNLFVFLSKRMICHPLHSHDE